MAHQAILIRETNQDADPDEKSVTNEIAKEFEGEPFLGPNSIVLTKSGGIRALNQKEFTSVIADLGVKPRSRSQKYSFSKQGSIYMIDCDPGNISPLAFSCLAHPSGICLSKDEKFLFVCETGRNRLLRFVLADKFEFRFTVFYQFSGRYGPTAIASHPESGNLYVSLFEFKGTLP